MWVQLFQWCLGEPLSHLMKLGWAFKKLVVWNPLSACKLMLGWLYTMSMQITSDHQNDGRQESRLIFSIWLGNRKNLSNHWFGIWNNLRNLYLDDAINLLSTTWLPVLGLTYLMPVHLGILILQNVFTISEGTLLILLTLRQEW